MKTQPEPLRVLVARSIEAIEDPRGACDDVRECDTVKEAKEFARYALTEAYQHSGEFSEPMNVSRVMRGDWCLAEYWRKGWRPAPVPAPVERNPAYDGPAGIFAGYGED